jgi:hypothetical protein
MSTQGDTMGLPLETLVEGHPVVPLTSTPDERTLLELVAGRFVSIAELSASLQMPLNGLRVRIVALSTAGRVRLHPAPVLPYNPGPVALATNPQLTRPAMTQSVLECALDGLATH